MEEIEKDVKRLIQDVMTEKGVKSYDIYFKDKTSAGDNYVGEILFLKVVPKNEQEPYDLVAKTAKRDQNLNKFLPMYMVYETEVFVYSKIFPTFRRLIEETNSVLKFDFVPKTYQIDASKGRETIIFENLKTRGFKVHDRKKTWNLDHSLMVMERYGQFHALSMALKDQKPEIFKELGRHLPDIVKEAHERINWKNDENPDLENAMELLRKHGREDLVRKYKKLFKEIAGKSIYDVENESDKIVFAHADCWNNNFMFKYENGDESKPTSMCLIDFQLTLPSSPVKDLSYNIYVTCDKSNLDHFDQLLKTYHDSLSRSLRKLGSDPEKLFNSEKLMEHWKKYGKFGLLSILGVLKACLVDENDAIDFADLSGKANNIEEFKKITNRSPKNSEEYNRRVLDAYIHFGDYFL